MNVVMAANPIGIVIVAIAGLVTALVVAYKRSETFRKIVDGVWQWIQRATKAVFGTITRVIGGALEWVRDRMRTETARTARLADNAHACDSKTCKARKLS